MLDEHGDVFPRFPFAPGERVPMIEVSDVVVGLLWAPSQQVSSFCHKARFEI